jgi:hypothetical protein
MKLLPIAWLAAALVTGAAQAQAPAGWTGDFTVRVESAGKRPLAASGAKTAFSGTEEWKVTHELRGTLPYAQRLRGAVARNQPDRNNEARYESWLARASSAGLPAQLSLASVRSTQSSGRYIKVDGEGAAEVNRQNAAKIGRVEHVRSRTEVKVDGPDGARMGGGYLQIDRVANQIRFETPTLQINPARTTVVDQWVARLDKAPAAGDWERNETITPTSTQELRIPPQLPYPTEFVFDVPAQTLQGAQEITLTQEFKAGFDADERNASRGVITLVLRRDAAAGAAAPPAAAQPAKGEARNAEPASAASPATPTVQDAAKAVDKLRGLLGR